MRSRRRRRRSRGAAGSCCVPPAPRRWSVSWPRRPAPRKRTRSASGSPSWSGPSSADARPAAGPRPLLLIAFMCGIVGYVGARPCRDLLVAGLEKLEYRGYDSAGLSVIEDGRVDSVRAVGHLGNLRAALEEHDAGGGVAVAAPPATTGVAHTRWATHGRVTEENAHPHSDTSDRVHIVLNGIVENHARLRSRLEGEGEPFSSETDAEVVAHLIACHYEGDLAAAVRAAFAELRGHYAFVAMHADQPGLLVGARRECPLVAGIGEGESFLASAIPAFLAETNEAVTIENDEIVTIDASGVTLTDAEGNPVDRRPEEISWDADAAEKAGYETFM